MNSLKIGFFIMMISALHVAAVSVTSDWRVEGIDGMAKTELVEHLNQLLPNSGPPTDQATVFRLSTRDDGDLESWRISVDDATRTIEIDGGTRGLLYGVYEFLERWGGVRWLDEEVTVIAPTTSLEVEPGVYEGAPHFRIRQIFDNLDWYERSVSFKVRNKGLTYAPDTLGGYFRIGSPRQHHTYYNYSADWSPETDAECFSMNAAGERLVAKDNAGPGQICMTNPKARAKVLESLRAYIRSDRTGAAPYPTVYDISPNDNDNQCLCLSCRALAEAHGGNYAAPLLDFTNFLAREIRRDYPEVQLRTFAYLYALNPVADFPIEENVIIHLAPMGLEFAQSRDTLKSLTAPGNAETADLLRQWSQIAPQLALWDYWVLFATDVQYPYVNVDMLQSNLRFYREVKSRDVFSECEFPEQQSFFGLKRYLGYKLLDDPDADVEGLTNEFFHGMYGDGATVMRQYYDYLRRRQTEDARLGFQRYDASLWGYLDAEFFAESLQLLHQAQQLTPEGSLARQAVEREYIPILAALLHLFGTNGIGAGYDFDALLAQYAAFSMAALAYYYPGNDTTATFRKALNERMERFRRRGGRSFRQADGSWLLDAGHLYAFSPAIRMVPDAEAANGEAMEFGTPEDEPEFHARDFVAGIYSVAKFKEAIPEFTLPRDAMVADGQYHWYIIGEVELDRFMYVYLHHSRLLQFWLRDCFDPEALQRYRIEVSLQFPEDGKSFRVDRLRLTPLAQ